MGSWLGPAGPPGRAAGGLEAAGLLQFHAGFGLLPCSRNAADAGAHSRGWECSGELRGGTVAVDLLIKINVLADKDDSVPIAIRSQDPARQ